MIVLVVKRAQLGLSNHILHYLAYSYFFYNSVAAFILLYCSENALKQPGLVYQL